MSTRTASPATIDNVSDTALWVAFYRAMETEREDALFHDPFARRLAGTRGEAIVDHMKRGRSLAWPMIVRTAVMDEIITDLVTSQGADMVLNLAAGLDARPWRLKVPPALRWIDVDLPAILQYKTETLGNERPLCRYEAVPCDLTNAQSRNALLDRLGAEAKRVLIVTEGLLIYLTPDQVASLARDLHMQQSFRWWLIDIASPLLLKFMERTWGKAVQRGNAPFQFAPAEGTAFFAPYGWKERVFRATADEARRLGREMRFAVVWRVVGLLMPKEKRLAYQRMSGLVLLERTDE